MEEPGFQIRSDRPLHPSGGYGALRGSDTPCCGQGGNQGRGAPAGRKRWPPCRQEKRRQTGSPRRTPPRGRPWQGGKTHCGDSHREGAARSVSSGGWPLRANPGGPARERKPLLGSEQPGPRNCEDEEEEPAGREVAVGAGGGPRAAGRLRTCPPGRGPFCHRGRALSRHAGATGHVVPVHAPKWGVSPSEENALSETTPPLERERANPAHGEDVPPRRCVRRCVWVGSSGPSFIAKRTGTVRPRARGAVSVRVRPPGGAVGSKMCGRSRGNAACGPSFLTWGGWGSPNRCHPRIRHGLAPACSSKDSKPLPSPAGVVYVPRCPQPQREGHSARSFPPGDRRAAVGGRG